jgi:Zinc knuckle
MICYHCKEPGHFASACPKLMLAEGFDEHIGRIEHFTAQWHAGNLTREEKRHLISYENRLYYDHGCRKVLLYP